MPIVDLDKMSNNDIIFFIDPDTSNLVWAPHKAQESDMKSFKSFISNNVLNFRSASQVAEIVDQLLVKDLKSRELFEIPMIDACDRVCFQYHNKKFHEVYGNREDYYISRLMREIMMWVLFLITEKQTINLPKIFSIAPEITSQA